MGLLGWMISKLTGRPAPAPAPATSLNAARPAGSFTVTFTGPTGPSVQVSDIEVAQRAKEHAFVLTTNPPALKTADQWWREDTHNRRLGAGSDKAYHWLLPFVPLEVVKLPSLQEAQERGPAGASALAKELRALIRVSRKAKEPHSALLRSLYGACVAADLSASLAFENEQPRNMARFVDIKELQAVSIAFETMGYQCTESLTKTDAKWLIEAFGEPTEHQSFDAMWPNVRRNAVSRYCWGELQRKNESAKSHRGPQQSMPEWLDELVKQNLGYFKEWQERVAARQEQLAERASMLETAWAATTQSFVVADLETTGLNAESDEVLEFAAVQVDPSGAVTARFSTLVRVTHAIPDVITKLTGITQVEADRDGLPLEAAMQRFLAFIGSRPVFFHNSPFDVGFIKRAAAQTRTKFPNAVHDTLPMARAAWPGLGTYKLTALAGHIGAPAPSHRARADANAALAVLLAARDITSPMHKARNVLAGGFEVEGSQQPA